MNAPVLSQHDRRWAGQRLGTMNGTTIGSHGCLVTCLTMANLAFDPGSSLMPNNVDDILTNGGGYVSADGKNYSPKAGANLVVWGRVQKLLPQLGYFGDGYYPDGTPADLWRIKKWLDAGGLVALQVYWHGNKSLMHFVLAVGYNGDDIIVNDPESGRQVGFSSRFFGTGKSAADIYAAHFYKDAIPTASVVVPAPVPPPPAPTNPVPAVAPKEEEVTQEQHQAAIDEMRKLYEQKLTEKDVMITQLNDKLAALVPEYVRTEQPILSKPTYLTTRAVDVVDFSDQKPPVVVGANEIVDGYSYFELAGRGYVRSITSHDNGTWYGYPIEALVQYAMPHAAATAPTETPVLDGIQPKLNASQQLNAMVADGVGFWRGLFSKLFKGGKK